MSWFAGSSVVLTMDSVTDEINEKYLQTPYSFGAAFL
jgi:hypothetical protein